jgi:hypothetical protein
VGVLQFVSSLVHALAWPVVVLVAVLLLRRPIAQALAGPMKRFKVGPAGVEAEFWQVSTVVEEALSPGGSGRMPRPASWTPFRAEMLKLAEVSPGGAILAALSEVETQLRRRVETTDAKASGMSLSELTREALARGLINDQTATAIEGLNVMHLLAIQGQGGETDARRAEEFITLAEAVLFALKSGMPVTRQVGRSE